MEWPKDVRRFLCESWIKMHPMYIILASKIFLKKLYIYICLFNFDMLLSLSSFK